MLDLPDPDEEQDRDISKFAGAVSSILEKALEEKVGDTVIGELELGDYAFFVGLLVNGLVTTTYKCIKNSDSEETAKGWLEGTVGFLNAALQDVAETKVRLAVKEE